ncbi:uncharacterized protein LOC132707737 [Cylas formicarius]|uniref:uncharacterized protein LOC132707737 n=1 Tax=Cylas formicarius TaxID=197179 RepID=UPI0029584093|nr:uncharacterized protein LOC132707737 [Cylas formicarius]
MAVPQIAWLMLAVIVLAHGTHSQYTGLRSIKPRVEPATGRIIGGYEAQPHSYPYAAALSLNYGSSFCAGSLISPNYVLTAAHCGAVIATVNVILGAHNFRNTSEPTQVVVTVPSSRDVIVHEQYDSTTLRNDIALIRLPQSVALTSAIQVAQLPSRSRSTPGTNVNDVTVALGWGLTQDVPVKTTSDLSPVLRAVNVTIMNVDDCAEYYNDQITYVTGQNSCTSGYKLKGTCDGDSGGPLVTRDGVLVGVTSFGTPDCETCYPSVYTDVSKYLDWIEQNSDVIVGTIESHIGLMLHPVIARRKMATPFAVLLFVALLNTAYSQYDALRSLKPTVKAASGRIVGGYEAEPHSYPFAAALSLNYGYAFCAGSLISPNYVLTAAHCGAATVLADVILGAHNFRNTTEATQVVVTVSGNDDVIIHEQYNATTLRNDIALIRLPRSVALSPAIQVATLPSRSGVTPGSNVDDVTIAVGWGVVHDVPGKNTGDLSPVLRAVNVTIMKVNDCAEYYNDEITYVTGQNSCTSGYRLKGTCDGDSGGPLVTKNGVLIGITSFGDPDCEACYPSVYTDVSKYLDWIERNSDVIIG